MWSRAKKRIIVGFGRVLLAMMGTVVYDTVNRRLDREYSTVEKSTDFQTHFVAKLSATNYASKHPYPHEY